LENRRDQIWHDVEVFEIQVALRPAGAIGLWQFETEIRCENDFTTSGYRKDYDAIVTLAVNGSSARVALEYERTCKSTSEYERICAELNRETRISRFLYLARSLQLQGFPRARKSHDNAPPVHRSGARGLQQSVAGVLDRRATRHHTAPRGLPLNDSD
jgi:hypothetical protein